MTATGPFDLVVVAAALVFSLVGTALWGVGREALATGLPSDSAESGKYQLTNCNSG